MVTRQMNCVWGVGGSLQLCLTPGIAGPFGQQNCVRGSAGWRPWRQRGTTGN